MSKQYQKQKKKWFKKGYMKAIDDVMEILDVLGDIEKLSTEKYLNAVAEQSLKEDLK